MSRLRGDDVVPQVQAGGGPGAHLRRDAPLPRLQARGERAPRAPGDAVAVGGAVADTRIAAYALLVQRRKPLRQA